MQPRGEKATCTGMEKKKQKFHKQKNCAKIARTLFTQSAGLQF